MPLSAWDFEDPFHKSEYLLDIHPEKHVNTSASITEKTHQY